MGHLAHIQTIPYMYHDNNADWLTIDLQMFWCDASISLLSSSLRGCHMSSEVDPVNHVPLQTGRLLSSVIKTNIIFGTLWILRISFSILQ